MKMATIKFNDAERYVYVYNDGKFAYKGTGFDWDTMTDQRWEDVKNYVTSEEDLSTVMDWS